MSEDNSLWKVSVLGEAALAYSSRSVIDEVLRKDEVLLGAIVILASEGERYSWPCDGSEASSMERGLLAEKNDSVW